MHEYTVEEKYAGNYRVRVVLDTEPCMEPFDYDMPDTWGIDLSNHRDYMSPTYGDEMPVSMEVATGNGETEDNWSRMQFFKNYYVLPVYMYDHSGRTVNTTGFSCPWDSGMAGFVYISKKVFVADGIGGVKKSMKAAQRRELAEQFLKNMVEELDYYMTGQVYGYVVEELVGEDGEEEWEEVESCWGFVGESDYCLAEGASAMQAFTTGNSNTVTTGEQYAQAEV